MATSFAFNRTTPCLVLLLLGLCSFTSSQTVSIQTTSNDANITITTSDVANETTTTPPADNNNDNNNSTNQTTLEQRVDQFLSQLPPEVLETTIEPADAGKMLGILFHLKNVVKAARMSGGGGKSMLTPLMLQMMASQIGGGSGSGGDPSKLHVSLNMKDMMPLVAHFLDSTSRKCHSGNGTFSGGGGAAGGGGGDTEALLAMMSNVFQQQQPTPQQMAADKLAAEKAEKGSFDFQQFIMQIATKMIADVASSAISGGRSAK